MTTTPGLVDRRNSRVTFALDKNEYFQPRAELLDQDFADVFYTREDFQSFRDEADAAVRLYRQQQRSHGKSRNSVLCVRGLEHRTCASSSASRRRRGQVSNTNQHYRAIKAVLREQSRQNETQGFDEEILAEVYKGFCITSVSQARRIAQADTEEASKYCTPEDELFGERSRTKTAVVKMQLPSRLSVAQPTRESRR